MDFGITLRLRFPHTCETSIAAIVKFHELNEKKSAD